MTRTLEVPAEGRMFDGHFPGRPILPGVAEIALVARAIGRAPVRAIPSFRFRSAVVPGDRLALSAREEEGGRVAVTLSRGGATVASGSLVFGPPTAPPRAAAAPEAARRGRALPLDALLPHRPPMRFVTRIAAFGAEGIACEAEIPADCPLAEGGSAPAFVAIEAAAQTAAVWEALHRARGGEPEGPRLGYLVGLRDVEVFAERLPAGAPLFGTVALDAAAPPLAHYRAEVSREGWTVVRGVVAVLGDLVATTAPGRRTTGGERGG